MSVNLEKFKSNYDVSETMKFDRTNFKKWLARLPNAVYSAKLGLVIFGSRTFKVSKSVVNKNIIIVKPIHG